MSPFRLGGEPNVRVGVATITSAPDGVALHEETINEMWSRSLKGQAAAECLRRLLASNGNPLERDQPTALKRRR
jgi:hypothetical protein